MCVHTGVCSCGCVVWVYMWRPEIDIRGVFPCLPPWVLRQGLPRRDLLVSSSLVLDYERAPLCLAVYVVLGKGPSAHTWAASTLQTEPPHLIILISAYLQPNGAQSLGHSAGVSLSRQLSPREWETEVRTDHSTDSSLHKIYFYHWQVDILAAESC